MYNRCQQGIELKFLVRLLSPSGLRIGLSTKSMETSFLEFINNLPTPQKEKMLSKFEKDIFGYQIGTEVQKNVPLKPMIGRAVRSDADAIEKFSKLAEKENKPLDLILEVKYDGERT